MATLLNKFPLEQIRPPFIKDTTHFLLQLEKLEPLPDNSLLVTLKFPHCILTFLITRVSMPAAIF